MESKELAVTLDHDNQYDSEALMVLDDGIECGHVPKPYNKIIHRGIQEGWLKISAYYLGYLDHDGQRRGGGPKLSAAYHLRVDKKVEVENIKRYLHRINVIEF